jgi:hypothetical protein
MDGTGDVGSAVDKAWRVTSPADLAEFLMELAERGRHGEIRVENTLSLEMIEASGAWVEGIESFLAARHRDIAGLSPWAAVAMVYSAGLIYE